VLLRPHSIRPCLINDVPDHEALVLAIGMKSGADKGGVAHRLVSPKDKLRNPQGMCLGSHVARLARGGDGRKNDSEQLQGVPIFMWLDSHIRQTESGDH